MLKLNILLVKRIKQMEFLKETTKIKYDNNTFCMCVEQSLHGIT